LNSQVILITANSTWNIYNFRLPLIRQLQLNGHRIVVVARKDSFADRLQAMNIEYIPLEQLYPTKKGLLNNFRLLLEYRSIIRRVQPSIIISFTIKPNIFSGVIARWFHIPFLPTLTGLGSLFTGNIKPNQLLVILYKYALKKAHKVIFHNDDDLAEFVQLKLIPREQGRVIPGSGVDVQQFSATRAQNKDSFVFLCIARLIREKGVLDFIHASGRLLQANLKNVSFRLIGPYDPEDDRSIDEEILRKWEEEETCHYGGFVEDIKAEIQDATVFVLPSMREGMPRAVLESMSIGRPVITTDVPGCRQAIEHKKNGIIVPPGDVSALAEAMSDMMKMSFEERLKMGSYGQKLVFQKYSAEVIVKQYEDILNEMMP